MTLPSEGRWWGHSALHGAGEPLLQAQQFDLKRGSGAVVQKQECNRHGATGRKLIKKRVKCIVMGFLHEILANCERK